MKIDSGDLNNGLHVSYDSDDDASDFTFVLHFHYVENPAVLIENLDEVETEYKAASIDDALKLKENYESNQ